jgi:hypothetical protein
MAFTATIASIELIHNGEPDELTYAWDASTSILSLGGFRRVDGTLTLILLQHATIANPAVPILGYLTISYDMDSNDIKDAILAYITSVVADTTVTVISETPASAVGSFTLELNYLDFYDKRPEFNVSSDDSCAWSIEGPVKVAVPLAQVSGIAAARGRLLAWDHLNAIYRSAILDPFDFTPSLSTQASVGQAAAVRGNIIHIQGIPDGYVIYSTDNITLATYSGDEYVFKYTEFVDTGISDPRHFAASADRHLVFSANGLRIVEPKSNKISPIDPILDTYLARYPWPIKLGFLADRYIVIHLSKLLDTDVILRANRDIPVIDPRLLLVPTPDAVSFPSYPANPGDIVSCARILVFDTYLSKWGSCDIGAMLLFSTVPLDASGLRMDKLPLGREDQYRSIGRGIGIADSTLAISIATRYPSTSKLHLGHLKAQPVGYTTLAELIIGMARAIGGSWYASVLPYAPDGTLISDQIYIGPASSAIQCSLAALSTGGYLDITVSGTYDINQLRVACFPQARL